MKKWLSLLLLMLLSINSMADIDIEWAAPEFQQHSLAGSLWQTDTRQRIQLETLLNQQPDGSWLLIGEQHDHPDHHRIQSLIINQLAAIDRLGNVAFEMANSDQQVQLDEWLRKGNDVTAEELNWSPGWPWERYKNQVTAALNHATRVIGADLPRAAQMQAYQRGAAEGQLDDAHSQHMMELIYTSHCEQLPREHLVQMLQVQLGRDQQMANAMIANTDPEKVNVLIAGSMHVRNDLGIPRWLEHPRRSLVLIPLEDSEKPLEYLTETYMDYPLMELSSDYLLFTPSMPEQDYCAAFE